MIHPPIVFIDVETTGGNARTSRVIDIGAIRVENGKVVKKMNQLINPARPIPAFITSLTGITNDMVWDAPSFDLIANELEELLHGAVFTAHHVDFDYSFIKAEFQRIGVYYSVDRACTVKLSRILDPEYHRHGLDRIIERMGYEVKNRHRGYDDAEVIWKFVRHYYEKDPVVLMTALSDVMIRSRQKTRVISSQLSFEW